MIEVAGHQTPESLSKPPFGFRASGSNRFVRVKIG
jgi:hypothetical protein